jgi:hypothetical protein
VEERAMTQGRKNLLALWEFMKKKGLHLPTPQMAVKDAMELEWERRELVQKWEQALMQKEVGRFASTQSQSPSPFQPQPSAVKVQTPFGIMTPIEVQTPFGVMTLQGWGDESPRLHTGTGVEVTMETDPGLYEAWRAWMWPNNKKLVVPSPSKPEPNLLRRMLAEANITQTQQGGISAEGDWYLDRERVEQAHRLKRAKSLLRQVLEV